MENRITNLEINNFKSIKHIKMDCKKINVLIGRPNVGKSNILEALSLFQSPQNYGNLAKGFLEDNIRFEKVSQLFYFLDRKKQIEVVSNLGFAAIWHDGFNYRFTTSPDKGFLEIINKEGLGHIQNNSNAFFEEFEQKEKSQSIKSIHGYFNDDLKFNLQYISQSAFYNPFKKYQFRNIREHKNSFQNFLLPPFGDNLFTIIENNRELWHEFAGLFNGYGFDLLLDIEEQKLFVQRKEGRYVTKIPYSLIADTLQRYIFHLAAIESNNDSILLFEEPESHLFPPYIIRLAERIIEDKSNQFFIATHSSDVLMTFLEQANWDNLGIFIADYADFETNIRQINRAEMQSVLDDGIDLLFNLRAFQE